MIDFNSSSSISGQITTLVDAGMQQARARQPERQYLGASRLGVACERALQFEYAKAPIDHGPCAIARCWPPSPRGGWQPSWISPSTLVLVDCRHRRCGGESISATGQRLEQNLDAGYVAVVECCRDSLCAGRLKQHCCRDHRRDAIRRYRSELRSAF